MDLLSFHRYFITFDIKFIQEQHPAATTGQGHSSPDVEETGGGGGKVQGLQGQKEGGTTQMWPEGGDKQPDVRLGLGTCPDVAGMGEGHLFGGGGHPDVAGMGVVAWLESRLIQMWPEWGRDTCLESGVIQMWPGW